MSAAHRIFTLAEARALLPQVRALTAAAVDRAAVLESEATSATDDGERTRIAGAHQEIVYGWARDVQALGCEVKGMWLVDFDSGDGLYYCWRHPEPELEFFHDYEAGFAGRRPLGRLSPN
jgi:hypothetical protein